MGINERYRGNASLAIVRDNGLYKLNMEFSEESLNQRLEAESTNSNFQIMQRYDGINPEAAVIVRRAVIALANNEEVDLEKLLE